MWFEYRRTIRFQDTDAAGVVYFTQILSICHEAYEASLRASQIDLKAFFSRGEIAVPLTHSSADFRRALMCGDEIIVRLLPTQTNEDSFEIQYQLLNDAGQIVATATTRHVCINMTTRQRQRLTAELNEWVQDWGRLAPPPPAVVEVND
ncbi:MAG: thioesterase family protein [Cyanobacteria bacterium P01_D01_bin.71]